MKVITRFPPSPTGHLHIGGGRTETFYQPYIDGEKELREINAEYIAGRVKG